MNSSRLINVAVPELGVGRAAEPVRVAGRVVVRAHARRARAAGGGGAARRRGAGGGGAASAAARRRGRRHRARPGLLAGPGESDDADDAEVARDMYLHAGAVLLQAVCAEALCAGCLVLANCAQWRGGDADSWPLRIGAVVAALTVLAVSVI